MRRAVQCGRSRSPGPPERLRRAINEPATLVAGTTVSATTLTSGALLGLGHRCCVVNAGTRPVANVVPQLRRFDGSDAGTNLCTLTSGTLEPGEACCAQDSSAISEVVYCVVTFDGAKSSVRATLAAESDRQATATSEAR